MKIPAMLALSSLLLAAPAGAAILEAPDYCLSFPGFTYTIVGKGFVVPKRGQCRAWTGFSPLGQTNADAPSSGTGCLSSDGTKLSLTITTSFEFVTLLDALALNMPTQAGALDEQAIDAGQIAFASAGAQGAVCKPSSNPIPNTAANSAQSAEKPHLCGVQSNCNE